MSSKHDDDFNAVELTFGDEEIEKPSYKCKNFFKKFFFSIIAAGCAGLFVFQIFLIATFAEVKASDYTPIHVDPVPPTDPVTPIDPVVPTDPVTPTDPVEPTDPVTPTDPVAPTDPVEPAKQ